MAGKGQNMSGPHVNSRNGPVGTPDALPRRYYGAGTCVGEKPKAPGVAGAACPAGSTE
jgi:hypothetical protein